MNNPRVIFAGTPEFARASLAALIARGIVPVAVLTQPDRPAGRGKRVTASPVKRLAEQHEIPVMQPATLRDQTVADALVECEPDLLIVAAYGLLLPQNVLDIPAAGCLNVHASLLPRWRGAAPIQAAILAGDRQTGISLMAMTAGLDCGPVFATAAIDIGDDETAGELHDRLAVLGGELLVEKLDDILNGALSAVEQDDARASYAGKISKQDARLDWSKDADTLARHVRAYDPVPGAYFFVADDAAPGADGLLRIKCWRGSAVPDARGAPGEVLESGRDGVIVACGDGGLRLEELQLPGKRRAPAREFLQQLDLNGRVLD
ncbi:MAG: methionyl-tRNA formyltransferase [Woeseiaceae bacterium]|nr:methionyl-tRNA formyltransferase [Woeseiaceae bacterium]